jgi:hypothetical protein
MVFRNLSCLVVTNYTVTIGTITICWQGLAQGTAVQRTAAGCIDMAVCTAAVDGHHYINTAVMTVCTQCICREVAVSMTTDVVSLVDSLVQLVKMTGGTGLGDACTIVNGTESGVHVSIAG